MRGLRLAGPPCPTTPRRFVLRCSARARARLQVVFLLAGVSWCRPCKGLTKPLEKMAARYAEGAVFLKMFGDQNDDTMRYFRSVLNVTATPALFAWRRGRLVYEARGGNKWKIEGCVRRFYDTDAYSLPRDALFPPRPQDLPLRPRELVTRAFPS
jgi:thiol-disulfide isomerase/thioredoxin